MATPERRGLLNEDSPAISSPATISDSPIPAKRFSIKHRPGYARVPSVSFTEDALARDITDSAGDDGAAPATSSESAGRSHGLGIAMASTPSSVPRVSSPLSQQEARAQAQASLEDRGFMSSPPSTGAMSGSTRFDQSFNSDYDTSYSGAAKHTPQDPRTSMSSILPPSIYAKSEAGLLNVRSHQQNLPYGQIRRSVKTGRLGNWVAIMILALAIFSTLFSVAYLIIALGSPRWGKQIRNNGGSLTPASAAFLTSLFAKLIELSFVTVVVAFVGQALARRAFKLENARGITLAEMSMRQWVMQPGTMLTQWESVRYAGVTLLGVISLIAAIMAVLYTSAATALVQPQLKYPDWRSNTMAGLVKASFANGPYIEDNCKTPITSTFDPPVTFMGTTVDYRGTTCLEIQHSALAFHNYHTWIGTWYDVVNNGSSGGSLDTRPPGYALHLDNTTITAPWIEQQNVTVVKGLPGRYINNVTMAMPHTGVISAAEDPKNELMQPTDIDGATMNIIASVPSPIVNVLCVTMTTEDLKPFVYELWDNYNSSVAEDGSWAGWPHNYGYDNRTAYLNGTVFDDVFGWGEKYGSMRYPPVFPRLPMQYNTIVNNTIGVTSWGRKSIYLLGRGPLTNYQGSSTVVDGNATNYAICQLQVGLTDKCSTHYSASASGATLEAHCEDPNDPLQYAISNPESWDGNDTLSADWPDVASVWATSLSLNVGVLDGNASNARLLTEFIQTGNGNDPTLLIPSMPSLAEALAVLSGCTLIDSVTDSPFVGKMWNYTIDTLTPGQYQYFNATVQDQQYISGGSQAYQRAFYIVLFGVVIMNFVVLGYFLAHRDWYTDFSEPMAMFSIAVNSPPSEKLAGSSATGPSGDQYRLSWKLNNEGGHFYYVENDQPEGTIPISSPRMSRRRWTESFEMIGTPNLKNRFSR